MPPPENPPEKPLLPEELGVEAMAVDIELEKLFMFDAKARGTNGLLLTYQLFVEGMLSRPSKAFAHFSVHSKTMA
jgi:hypothetical protein